METFLVGVDHQVAPLAVRERLAVPRERVPEMLAAVQAEAWVEETLLLITCNRTELYVVSREANGSALALEALRRHLPGAPEPASGLYRERAGETAALHLFRVASGLESAILGETEVQGQVREAHEAAQQAGTTGRVLDRLLRGALQAGKRVRAETALAAGGISHGSAAAQVARRVFGTLERREVLVVGAGAMAEQSARALAALGGSFVVCNRTREKAEALAAGLPSGRVAGLDEVVVHLARVHVAVLAGGSLLEHARVAPALARRRDPLVLVDLGVPRLADPRLEAEPGVFVYDLEALERLVADALAQRREAIPAAEAIVAEEFAAFRAWHRTLGALPTIHSLQAWAERLRLQELGHLPAGTPEAVREAVDHLTRHLVRKLLARPASRVVRGMEKEDPRMPTPDALRQVFGLDEEGPR